MRYSITLFGLLTIGCAVAQEATLDLSPENLPVLDPTITDCATDHKKRGRPTETPVDAADVTDLRTALDIDLRASTGGLDELQALEPFCFYLVPDGRLLLRDARGLEYYFHKVPKWQVERIDIITRPD